MDVNTVLSSVKEKKMLEVEECRLCQLAIDSYVTAAVPNQIQAAQRDELNILATVF